MRGEGVKTQYLKRGLMTNASPDQGTQRTVAKKNL